MDNGEEGQYTTSLENVTLFNDKGNTDEMSYDLQFSNQSNEIPWQTVFRDSSRCGVCGSNFEMNINLLKN